MKLTLFRSDSENMAEEYSETWSKNNEEILFNVAEQTSDEHVRKLAINLGVRKQTVKDILRKKNDAHEKRFLVLRKGYRITAEKTPLKLATCLTELEDLPVEDLKLILEMLPLGFNFKLKIDLIKTAYLIPRSREVA